jgi:BirA family biotin operon repressor/biotin-[acetyl-CoA-carboxylase] ligase
MVAALLSNIIYVGKMKYNIIHLSETDSTNRYLNTLFAEGDVEDLTTVVADFQTAGRGQRGNTWNSDEGANLLFSIALNPTFMPARDQFLVSQAVSLAMKEALSDFTGDISIKWPNDIYWRDRKIAGILIENVLSGNHIAHCVIGIGLNVNQKSFREDIPNPVSLAQITGHDEDKESLLDSILSHLARHYEEIRLGKVAEMVESYKSSLFRRQGLFRYRDANGEFEAEIADVEEDGRFVLRDSEGRERKYLFKEVEYII